MYLFVFITLHISRKFYIRRNNNKVDSIGTACVIIADLLC